ncbi:hypothetical protein HK101_000797 [Irineochytrium annulatum]|nr:hypothetical protein HK101_000797 [Irineochytrium annulatum]
MNSVRAVQASSVTVIATAAAAAAIATLLYRLAGGPLRKIPGPPAFPVIGNFPLIFQYKAHIHELWKVLKKKYGDIYKVDMVVGGVIVRVADPASVKSILSDPDTFVRITAAPVVHEDIFYHALFFLPTDAVWHRHRKFLQPGFGPTHLRHTLAATNEIMDNLLSIWDHELGAGNVKHVTDLFHVASSLTIDVIAIVAFSHRYGNVQAHLDPDARDRVRSYQAMFDVMAQRIRTPHFLWKRFRLLPEQVRAKIQGVKAVVMETITAKRALQAAGRKRGEAKTDEARDYDKDVLDRMLETSGWTDEEILDEVIALFLAGGETSANTIVNTALALDAYPECRDRMCAEIDTVLGSSDGDHVTWEMLGELKYTECVIKESLRLYPVLTSTLPRRTTRAGVEVMGYVLPKGQRVQVDIQGIHQDERWWKHAGVFMPSRWMNGFTPAPGTYLPFADGPHTCLGFKMAMIELVIQASSVATVTAVAAGSALVALLYRIVAGRTLRKIPGPAAYPLIGNFPLLIKYKGHLHDLWGELKKKYGDLYKIDTTVVGHIIHCADPSSVKGILASDNYVRLTSNSILHADIFKHALFFLPTDDTWRRHRKFLQPGFGPTHLRQALVATNEIMDNLLSIWDRELNTGSKHVTDLFHVASSVTIDVIAIVAFSHRYGNTLAHLDADARDRVRSYQVIFEVLGDRIMTPPFLWGRFGIRAEQVAGKVGAVKKVVLEAIAAKRAVLAEAKNECGAKTEAVRDHEKDVLDRMLETSGWDDEEITDEVIALFLAGGETSANTIVNCALLLDAYPECRDRMVAELDAVLGTDSDDTVTWDQLHELKYTECIIKESLRLNPVVTTSIPRVTAKAGVEVMGHKLPKGTLVQVDIQNIHTDERFWKHASVFMPSRWLDGFTPAAGTFMPFGDGPHMCIGWKMAMIEL